MSTIGNRNRGKNREKNKRLSQGVFFWGKNTLLMLAMVIGAAFLMLIMNRLSVTDEEFTGLNFFFVYPYYLLTLGAFIIVVYMITMFSIYYSVLLSLGATRRRILCGISLMGLGMTAGLAGITALIWLATRQEEMEMLPLFIGVWLMSVGGGIVFGGVTLRFGMVGTVILLVACSMLGGVTGFLCAAGGGVVSELFDTISGYTRGFWSWRLLLAGVLIFTVCSGITAVMMRRSEVRR